MLDLDEARRELEQVLGHPDRIVVELYMGNWPKRLINELTALRASEAELRVEVERVMEEPIEWEHVHGSIYHASFRGYGSFATEREHRWRECTLRLNAIRRLLEGRVLALVGITPEELAALREVERAAREFTAGAWGWAALCDAELIEALAALDKARKQ